MSYPADRAAFISALMISEAEDAMRQEKPHSFRHRQWQKVHDIGMALIAAYDNGIDQNGIYDLAGKAIAAINETMAAR